VADVRNPVITTWYDSNDEVKTPDNVIVDCPEVMLATLPERVALVTLVGVIGTSPMLD
jgi:hypothetical protein